MPDEIQPSPTPNGVSRDERTHDERGREPWQTPRVLAFAPFERTKDLIENFYHEEGTAYGPS